MQLKPEQSQSQVLVLSLFSNVKNAITGPIYWAISRPGENLLAQGKFELTAEM